MMVIEFASTQGDLAYLEKNDRHITVRVLHQKFHRKEIIVAREGSRPLGWLRFGYFWDIIPIMNMLAVEDQRQREGIGTSLVRFWENEMRKEGHSQVMTSTLSDETAQHLYRKLGYQDSGALLLPGEALEIIMIKSFEKQSTR